MTELALSGEARIRWPKETHETLPDRLAGRQVSGLVLLALAGPRTELKRMLPAPGTHGSVSLMAPLHWGSYISGCLAFRRLQHHMCILAWKHQAEGQWGSDRPRESTGVLLTP